MIQKFYCQGGGYWTLRIRCAYGTTIWSLSVSLPNLREKDRAIKVSVQPWACMKMKVVSWPHVIPPPPNQHLNWWQKHEVSCRQPCTMTNSSTAPDPGVLLRVNKFSNKCSSRREWRSELSSLNGKSTETLTTCLNSNYRNTIINVQIG